jgi:hypothetical protein
VVIVLLSVHATSKSQDARLLHELSSIAGQEIGFCPNGGTKEQLNQRGNTTETSVFAGSSGVAH